jgi:radical SAM superfamily enzyme YgiQ (UPF0313 family)
MAKAGAKTVYIGVESPDPEALTALNKNVEADAASQAVALLKRNNLETLASYIIGGINDDIGAILRTIKFARSLDTAAVQFTILTPYPGTVLFNKLKDRMRHKKWHLYDGMHLVFRHRHVSYAAMELLLIWGYLSFYARGWRAIKGFAKAFVNNARVMKGFGRRPGHQPLSGNHLLDRPPWSIRQLLRRHADRKPPGLELLDTDTSRLGSRKRCQGIEDRSQKREVNGGCP